MAAIYPANNYRPPHYGDFGNAAIFTGSADVAATLADSDQVRPVFVAAGTLVSRVVIRTPDLDSGGTPELAGKIGFVPADGSPAPSGADAAVAAEGAWGQSAATTVYEILPPYMVAEDSYLCIAVTVGAVLGPAGTGTGTVYASVTGEQCGGK